ncbi:MAG: hypothetical protein AAF517_10060 [Planctomycetota bacterium]
MSESAKDPRLVEDPVFKNTRREALIVLSAWALCFVYTCTYCYLNGYTSHDVEPSATGGSLAELADFSAFDRDPSTLTTPFGLGIPDWVFYGILTPWVLCIMFTIFFCQFIFREEDLGDDALAAAPEAASEGGSDG